VSRLRAGAVVPLAWAGLIAIQSAILFAFPAGLLVHLLNAGMVVTMLLIGAALLTRRRGRDEAGTTRPVPDGSAATLLLAAGVAAAVLGAALGTWLLLIGGGLALLGLAGLVRERRGERGT
jgi:heme A synthase